MADLALCSAVQEELVGGCCVGNYPQALTHATLVRAALALTDAEQARCYATKE